MIILAIDVSAISSGVAVLDDGYIIHYSLIKPKAKNSYGERLTYFANAITNLVKEYNPNEIIIEDIFKGRNQNTFKILARFQGVAIQRIYELTNKDPYLLTAVEVRKKIGCGQDKEEAFKYIKKKFKLKKFNFDDHNDIADSIALGLALEKVLDEKSISGTGSGKKRKSRRNKKS